MILREFGIYTDAPPPSGQRPIHDQTRCLLARYEAYLPRVDTQDIWKVSAELSPAPAQTRIIEQLGVACVPIAEDPLSFFDLSRIGKKRAALSIIDRALTSAVALFGWPSEPFALAHQAVLDSEFSTTWAFCPKWNPGRRFQAYLHCEHEPEVFTGELRIRSRDGTIVAKQVLVSEIPNELCFGRWLGRVNWLDRERAVLLDRRGQPVGVPLKAAA